ncbi:MAG: UPF0056 inner membrane protein [Lysobacteraceae bacterium]|nr:MAG: UPF0056 inner membrane protein [Xanthomonadaceae bacterium]
MELLSAALMLFVIMDPLGNIPFFLSALEPVEEKRRLKVLIRELLIALGVMLAFLFSGEAILKVLGLRQESISIAGGIILFLIALKMIFPVARAQYEDSFSGEPFIVPLAIPFVAGPSVLAALLLLVSEKPGQIVDWTMAIGLAWVATAAILMAASRLRSLLGDRGLVAIERLMGMLLVAVSVQMFLDGVASYLSMGS